MIPTDDHLSPEERNTLQDTLGYLYFRETFGTVDGPGVRYIFFLQGCVYRCLYCHNPDSIPPRIGEAWTAGQVLTEAMRYRNYTKGGVTFSGGEPLLQSEFLLACIKLLKAQGIHVAIDTAGLPLTPFVKACVDAADMLLLDIKSMDEEMAFRLTGRTNADSLAMLDYCERQGKTVWIRQVLLRDYTLDDDQLEALAEHLEKYTCINRVELLPFHKLGEPKWTELNRVYELGDVEATSKEEAEHAREILRAHGLTVY